MASHNLLKPLRAGRDRGVAWGAVTWVAWAGGSFIPYLATVTILVGVAGVSIVTMSSYATAVIAFSVAFIWCRYCMKSSIPRTPRLTLLGMLVVFVVRLVCLRTGKDCDPRGRKLRPQPGMVDRLHTLVTHDR